MNRNRIDSVVSALISLNIDRKGSVGKTVEIDFMKARVTDVGVEEMEGEFVLVFHTEGDFVAYYPWTTKHQHGGYRKQKGDSTKGVYLESAVTN
jgi:hypothetical protein